MYGKGGLRVEKLQQSESNITQKSVWKCACKLRYTTCVENYGKYAICTTVHTAVLSGAHALSASVQQTLDWRTQFTQYS